MRLSTPFCRLPISFDVEALQKEVLSFPEAAWAPHPNQIAGNSSLRLISAGGGENDLVDGEMLPTEHLRNAPYIRQILASFGVVWSRSRLLRLAPGADVPQHADINYHWFYRVRVHIPIFTTPDVTFHCDTDVVHMRAGETWIFDNWRQHHVENRSDQPRIHLVADTTGSAAFWNFVSRANDPNYGMRLLRFDPSIDAMPLSERTALSPVMHPAEVELLLLDLRAELVTLSSDAAELERLAVLHTLLDAFCRDWRQLYALHGTDPTAWNHFAALRDGLRENARELSRGIVVRSNRVAAFKVIEGRVLRVVCPVRPPARRLRVGGQPLGRPLIILAAPRSGSTLLFETLAASTQLCTVGGEGHLLFEGQPELQPGAAGVESNRLLAEQCTDDIAARIHAAIESQLVDAAGQPVRSAAGMRFLEKTPKNALRLPFLERLFPDAQFLFLWRDPRENIASIIEAWKSGRWKTYNGLPGFEGPWSLLLPPGWQAMQGKPLEQIAAFQWESTNRILLDDLASLGRDRWMSLSYDQLVAAPRAAVDRVLRFAGLASDPGLDARLAAALPNSRYTNTPPEAGKWRRDEARVLSVLPGIEATWQRLRALESAR